MRKLLVLLVVVAALGAGYSAYWHRKADDFKQMFVQSADALNTNAKPFTKELQLLKYDSVSVTGFPFAMVLEVSKPVLDLPVSALAEKSQRSKGITTPMPFEWVEEISYGDKVTLTGSVMGDHYTFTTNGDRTHKSLVNHSPRHNLVATSSSPFVCNLGVEKVKGGTPWTMQPIFTDPTTFLAIFRSFDCGVKDIAVKEATSGKPLYSANNFLVSTSNEPSGAGHAIALMLDMDKAKATPAFDAIYHDYILMFNTLMGKADEVGEAFPASEAGEQSLKVDIRYDGPTEAKDFADPGMSVHFDVNAFNGHSALNDMAFEAHMASVPQGNDRTVSITVHEHSEVSARYDEIIRKYFASVLAGAAKAPATSDTDPAKQFFRKLAAIGAPDVVVANVWPDFHSLGKTSFDVDFNVKGPKERGKLFKTGVAALDSFDWQATPYGFKIKGNANGSVPGKLPSGDLAITCISCDALLGDLGNYAMRIEAVLDRLGPVPKQPMLNKDLIDAAMQFLHGISENASAKDLIIHFVMNDHGFTVSGKQVPEVLALYMTTVAPHFPQPSPSAGGQPEPPRAPTPGLR